MALGTMPAVANAAGNPHFEVLMLRILHTSDWHLGKSLGTVSLRDDQRHALDQIHDHLRAHRYDVLIVAGDIFDRATPDRESVLYLGRWMAMARELAPAMAMVLIAGNHDNGPRLAWTAALLDQQNIYLRGEADAVEEPIEITAASGQRAQLWALPFLAAGEFNAQTRSQVEAMDEALRRIRPRQDSSQAQVLIGHCFVAGGKPSDSERTLVGSASQIDVAVFTGFDYVALGHLHRAQAIAPHVHYSGSIARYSFSEVDYAKQFLAVEVAPGQPCRVQRHPLRDLRPMRRLSGSLAELLADPKYAAMTDDYVELTLTPPAATGNPLEELRTRWTNILSFRNELPAVGGALALPTVGESGARDLEAEFVRFDSQFTSQPQPAPEVLAAFRQLRVQLAGREAA